jgi:hypothetical protein
VTLSYSAISSRLTPPLASKNGTIEVHIEELPSPRDTDDPITRSRKSESETVGVAT